MKVILMSKASFNVIQLNSVSSITYSSGNVTIVHGGGTAEYQLDMYLIQILP